MIPADRAFTECIKGVIAFQNTQTVCLLATVRKQRLASFGCFFFFLLLSDKTFDLKPTIGAV